IDCCHSVHSFFISQGLSQIHHSLSEKRRDRVPHPQDTFKPQAWPKDEPQLNTQLKNSPGGAGPLRCGVPDYPDQREVHLSRHPRQKRFVIFGGRWPKTDLTYKIQRFPWQMREDKVKRVLQEALKVWSDVTPLTFTEVISQEADIVIDFARYWHGDNLPFDGPGGILAHAFFPRTHREGDIHFDYDESWTVGNELGTDLLQVAAHEFGHVLGLQHSLEPGALMSPFYSFSYPLQLSEDDKKGIQYLYVCALHSHLRYPISSRCHCFYAWRIREGRLQAGYPALASRHWRGIPENIGAAYEDKKGNIWFFEGGCAIFCNINTLCYEFPFPINELVVCSSGFAVFISRRQYWRFDPAQRKVLEGYPRYVGADFFGCSMP
uniref:Matrix metallopeptidase 11 n=1 Tax=Sinocyclocheilus grahami TaxID=75366 RepID=A0A672R7M0_SINGR